VYRRWHSGGEKIASENKGGGGGGKKRVETAVLVRGGRWRGKSGGGGVLEPLEKKRKGYEAQTNKKKVYTAKFGLNKSRKKKQNMLLEK